jgi:nucleoside-diphosphate-sugar epimerase
VTAPAAATRTVLVTGASGVIGRALIDELRPMRVIGLVHSDTSVPGLDAVVTGDVAQPRFGLGPAEWDRLCREVDVIVHSAALTEWGQPPECYQRVNVDGTTHVIELALASGAPVHYVSTCFVRAVEQDRLDELSDGNVVRPYIVSKLQAERLLADAGVPHSVYRPTNLVGDSRTGASSRPQIVQMLSHWICRGRAPYFPLHDGNLIDFLSLDVAAIAIARAVHAGDLGRLYWLTSGAAAMSAERTLDIVLAHAAGRGRPVAAPPIADPSRPLPVAWADVSPTSRAFVTVLFHVSEVTRACGGTLPSSLAELYERYDLPRVAVDEAYRKSLDYWADERSPARLAEEPV